MTAYAKQTIVDYTRVDAQAATAAQKELLAAYEGRSAFDLAVVKTLETYLEEQVANATIDIDADLALLKLYLVHPETADATKIATVLVKALMAFPSSFFSGTSAIIPESFREDENIKQLLSAGHLLQSCRFEDFWKLELPLATKFEGFTDAVRAFIIEAIRKSHSVVSTSVLAAKLNVSDVQPVITAEQWTVEGEVITVTPNDDNQMRPKKIQENIEFDDVLKVIHTLSR